MLTEAGADVNLLNSKGMAPLNIALEGDNLAGMKNLVRKGAKLYYPEKHMREKSPIY